MKNSIISVIVFWIIYLVIILLRYFLLNNDKWLLSNEQEKITWFSFFMRGLYFEILPCCIKSRQNNYIQIHKCRFFV